MFTRIIRNNLRRPLYSLAILLFALVMTVVLCYLHKAGEEEMRSFESTYVSVPVTFRVTDLDGSKPDLIEGWIVDLFTEQGMKPNLAPFVKALYTRISLDGKMLVGYEEIFGISEKIPVYEAVQIAAIDSLYVAEELTEDWGGEVHWYEGYDESILSTEEKVCLVPESMQEWTELDLYFTYTYEIDGVFYTKNAQALVKVVGYYVDKGNSRIYCPYPMAKLVCAELAKSKEMNEICAILNDNHNVEQLREVAAKWFAEPNPSGEKTEWGEFGYQYFFYALDIDDYMLRNLESNMKSSMQLNQLSSAVVFVLSAGAGFLTGFLVIRARKREIALMRTMGASHVGIFLQLALEQMACVAAGVFLGGAVFLWQPPQKLGLFAGIYFIGLSLALVIFLTKNLLTTIKEDE